MRLTEQNEVGHKATVFINNLVGPKGLKSIEGTYANIHELNYLAKRMDSFDGTEMGKLLAAASRFDTRDLRQMINYTFNLGRITLIQNISDMQTVGVEHYMDIHGGCCSNEEYRDPKRAEEGRALLNSKRGIWTDYGLMFINDEVPWEEVYNGMPSKKRLPRILTACISKTVSSRLLQRNTAPTASHGYLPTR